ncbi:SusD-like starch-binding protein associating with outer membrane [Chitinophaga niastensis]|uniref:SusD-like starch-binding protein associating with outer membrane n=1 Tax=Chitinophaga niastensis TaxID=536980 RepID=A0A2P8HHB8_CHINA|nr:SusD/RagB family nutrient-binding outer membrane lipoprotein [Chitinophaga niastensis]PSL45589.1 SusD-like starch-binding protein associating with outer membrane [Chitinophaga niastensis]
MKLIYNRWMLAIVAISILFTGCRKIDDLQKNPNVSDQASPKLLLTGIEYDMYDNAWSGYSYAHRMAQFFVLNFDYYGNQSYSWGAGGYDLYTTLRNVDRLEIEASKQGANMVTANYKAIAKFMRAWAYSRMTEQMGDIPLSDAMKAPKGIYYPKYDQQKEVFKQCLQWLDDANTQLDSINKINPATAVEGDVFFNGDISKWRKAVNSLSLRILITLSKKENDADLNIKQRFNTIVSNPAKYPVMTDNNDNLQMTYNSTDKSNNFPLYPSGGLFYVNRNPLGATWVDILTSLKDSRIFKIAQPAAGIADDPLNPFARYKGAKTGDIQSYVQDQTNQGKYASLSQAYWLKDASGIPCIQLSVSETCFNIAEGINRGWANGDAAASYTKGIELSSGFYGVTQSPLFWIQPEVAYKGNNAAGLNQILTQKYVAFFENSGYEAYYNYRRTGVPTFNIGPSNENTGLIPVRFSYPQSEYTNNGANVQAAVQSQFGGSDTRNDVMWLLK